ncbi:MAG: L-2-amino-thiazoline-4-carboxylic acid hydrolase [Anaerolineae bacterium]|nr:L-2-amino-thiazoline-4-carboxylic acid hydrolase [Anaerolineae bacterium]
MDSQAANSETGTPVSHMERRAIQAPLAACLIREFMQELGEEKALSIAANAIQKDAALAGQALAKQIGQNDLAQLSRVVREIWAQNDALTFNILVENDTELSFNVIGCRYVNLYEKSGLSELGFCLSCARDEAFARGFNPHIRLTRSQTLMQGADCCDFRFTLQTGQ